MDLISSVLVILVVQLMLIVGAIQLFGLNGIIYTLGAEMVIMVLGHILSNSPKVEPAHRDTVLDIY